MGSEVGRRGSAGAGGGGGGGVTQTEGVCVRRMHAHVFVSFSLAH